MSNEERCLPRRRVVYLQKSSSCIFLFHILHESFFGWMLTSVNPSKLENDKGYKVELLFGETPQYFIYLPIKDWHFLMPDGVTHGIDKEALVKHKRLVMYPRLKFFSLARLLWILLWSRKT